MVFKFGRKNDAYEVDDEIEGKYVSNSEFFEGNNEYSSDHQLDEKSKDDNKNMVPFFSLFQFSFPMDKLMMTIGTIAALANGALLPIMLIVFSAIIDEFTFDKRICQANFSALNSTGFNMTSLDIAGMLSSKVKDQVIWLILLGIATMILSYFQVSFWLMPAERQTRQIRTRLFQAILRQDIGWFDIYKSDGMSDKLGNAIQYFATFISGIVIGFIKGWKLTLVVLSLAPILFTTATLFSKVAGILTTQELKAYAKAGSVAEEVFTAIRTVFAFNGVKKEHKRYESRLDEARLFGIKKSAINGLVIGILWLVINAGYALGFWYGWKLTTEVDKVTGKSSYTVGTILIVFFSIIIAIFSLGNAAPYFATLTNAKVAAYEVFDIIKRVPPIDVESTDGEVLEKMIGDIKFNNVSFKYPSRPTVQILNNLNLHIEPGKIVALVGSSGCGKSTCIQLLQRFYDPLAGNILIDDKHLKDLNLNWWRTHIGVVNQEPVLFATTIAENIRMGKQNATQEEIEESAKNANAHDFILKLPDKYETLVGNRGSQLSGGQKQRIAIARALIRDPKILLLDEATSALDNQSEAIVQAALDRASQGRTTIIIAHRLSTIRNADVIYAMQKGKLVESGTHDELMEQKGIYYQLVIAQQSSADGVQDEKRVKKEEVVQDEEAKVTVDRRKSVAKVEKKGKKVGEKKQEPSMGQILALNKPEWYFIVIGSIASLISGAVQPAFAIVFSKIISIFSECDINKQKEAVNLFCGLFVIFGVITFCSQLTQASMFGISGENLTKRLRSMGFRAMLSQDVSWYDDPTNNVGALCTRLSVEASAVQGATGSRIGYVLMTVGNLGTGIILAFVYGWALTLVILGFLPFLILAGALQTRMMTGFSKKDKEILEEAGKITNEAIGNIRTVAILNKEKKFVADYSAKVKAPFKAAVRSANLYAAMLGITNSITYYANAAAFSFGAYLVEEKLFGMDFERIMLVFSVLVFGAQSAGQAASFLPDYAKAKAATVSMLELFARKPKINNWESQSTKTISDDKFNGDIVFNKIQFHYPTRPNVKVLNDLVLTVKKGQRVALVGSSGCGKSTVTQLLERFYDLDSGTISISDVPINELDTRWVRQQIGLVSQEPILFDTSIADNIAYGCEPGTFTMEKIIEAAKQANIHNFISKLPKGYETNVGSKGAQLSGGEKQRIAIARALIRNPKILLLDEATSALDNEAEKIVEEALEKAQEGRTCIVIAHRLSTIQNADVIYVMKDGVITESGTHEQLLELDGFYAKLHKK